MPFSIKKRDSYRWTVEHVLSLKNGKPDEVMTLDVEFKALSAKEAGAALDVCRTDAKEFFKLVLVGWHDAPEGWEFSLEKFEELLEAYPGMSGAFMRAYLESNGAAARKN